LIIGYTREYMTDLHGDIFFQPLVGRRYNMFDIRTAIEERSWKARRLSEGARHR